MSSCAIEARDLSYAYPDGQQALRGVSFRIHHGESVAIVGSNGAGKSTLLLHLNGVLKATSGDLRIGGVPVSRDNLVDIRREVGMIFQNPDDQLFMPRVFDDVAFGPRNMGLSEPDIESRVDRALATVGAGHLSQRSPSRLSGGEKRAVAIAGVLAMAPSILVMDEPGNGLDPAARRRVIKLLAGLDHTRVIATHDLDMALELCSRALVMQEGVIVADGTPAALFADEDLLERCRLELPLSYRRPSTFLGSRP